MVVEYVPFELEQRVTAPLANTTSPAIRTNHFDMCGISTTAISRVRLHESVALKLLIAEMADGLAGVRLALFFYIWLARESWSGIMMLIYDTLAIRRMFEEPLLGWCEDLLGAGALDLIPMRWHFDIEGDLADGGSGPPRLFVDLNSLVRGRHIVQAGLRRPLGSDLDMIWDWWHMYLRKKVLN